LGRSTSPDLGEVVVQVGQQPHEEGGEQRRTVLHRGQLEHPHRAAAVGPGAQQVAGVEFHLAEEGVGALVLEPDERAEDHPRGRLGQRAETLQLGLALVAEQVLDDRAQVFEVEQRQPVGVREVEDQAE